MTNKDIEAMTAVSMAGFAAMLLVAGCFYLAHLSASDKDKRDSHLMSVFACIIVAMGITLAGILVTFISVMGIVSFVLLAGLMSIVPALTLYTHGKKRHSFVCLVYGVVSFTIIYLNPLLLKPTS